MGWFWGWNSFRDGTEGTLALEICLSQKPAVRWRMCCSSTSIALGGTHGPLPCGGWTAEAREAPRRGYLNSSSGLCLIKPAIVKA